MQNARSIQMFKGGGLTKVASILFTTLKDAISPRGMYKIRGTSYAQLSAVLLLAPERHFEELTKFQKLIKIPPNYRNRPAELCCVVTGCEVVGKVLLFCCRGARGLSGPRPW